MSKAKVITLPQPKPQVVTVKRKAPAQNKGPLGDLENFSMARWLLATDEEIRTGQPASRKAPFEAAIYAKASQREAVGQDGGFLGPEEWNLTYYQMLRGIQVLPKLPIEEVTTKSRVVHIARGAGEWTISYVGENTTLTSGDRTVAGLTFTMHKQTALGTLPRTDCARGVCDRSSGSMR